MIVWSKYLLFADKPIWCNFEATVSTNPKQDCDCASYLQKEWEEDGRRSFHMCRHDPDSSILFSVPFAPKYASLREKQPQLWKGNRHRNLLSKRAWYTFSDCSILPKMAWNISRILWNFQFRQIEICGVPRYGRFCAVLPNTVPLLKASMGGWLSRSK